MIFLQFLKQICTQHKILRFWYTFWLFSRIFFGGPITVVLFGKFEPKFGSYGAKYWKMFFYKQVWEFCFEPFLLFWSLNCQNCCTLLYSGPAKKREEEGKPPNKRVNYRVWKCQMIPESEVTKEDFQREIIIHKVISWKTQIYRFKAILNTDSFWKGSFYYDQKLCQ